MPEKDYSGTPLPKKLGITAGARVALVGAPQGFDHVLGTLPEDVDVRTTARGRADVAVLFATRTTELRKRFSALARAVAPDGGVWIAWPKRASAIATDLDFRTVQEVGLDAGLVDNKSCAIDDDWQALRFVVRLRDR